jgi:hypothetical protein
MIWEDSTVSCCALKCRALGGCQLGKLAPAVIFQGSMQKGKGEWNEGKNAPKWISRGGSNEISELLQGPQPVVVAIWVMESGSPQHGRRLRTSFASHRINQLTPARLLAAMPLWAKGSGDGTQLYTLQQLQPMTIQMKV